MTAQRPTGTARVVVSLTPDSASGYLLETTIDHIDPRRKHPLGAGLYLRRLAWPYEYDLGLGTTVEV